MGGVLAVPSEAVPAVVAVACVCALPLPCPFPSDCNAPNRVCTKVERGFCVMSAEDAAEGTDVLLAVVALVPPEGGGAGEMDMPDCANAW